jgi:hypothetical protein
VSPRAPQGGTLSTRSRRPGPPPSRGPGSPCDSRTSLVHTPALRPGRSGVVTCSVTTVLIYMQDRVLRGPRNATTPRLEDCTPYSDDHAACWGWQGAGAISARPRTIPRTTATPDAMPHSVRPLHPRDSGERRRLPRSAVHCTPSLLMTIKGGGGPPFKGDVFDIAQSDHSVERNAQLHWAPDIGTRLNQLLL